MPPNVAISPIVVVLAVIFVLFLLLEAFLDLQKDRRVKGSHERYVLASWLVVVLLIKQALTIVITIILLGVDTNYIFAGIWTAMAIMNAWRLFVAFDDDNWFNDQFTKLKKRFKQGVANLKGRLSSSGSPLPSPA